MHLFKDYEITHGIETSDNGCKVTQKYEDQE
jgi:hypothetical protein